MRESKKLSRNPPSHVVGGKLKVLLAHYNSENDKALSIYKQREIFFYLVKDFIQLLLVQYTLCLCFMLLTVLWLLCEEGSVKTGIKLLLYSQELFLLNLFG